MTLVSGLGALVALMAMLVFIAVGPDDGDRRSGDGGPFPAGSLAVAVQDDQLASVAPDLLPSRIERIAASGVRFARVEVRWVDIAATRPATPSDPGDPVYAWGRYDVILDGLATRAIQPIVVFSGSPSWSNGGKDPNWLPALDDYGAFVRAFATRYDGGSHAKVDLYEPWDEPNTPAKLLPQWDETVTPVVASSPVGYAAMVVRAGVETRAANPDAYVIGLSLGHVETSAPPLGGVSVSDFVQGLVPLAPPMDAVAIHLEPAGAPNAPSEVIPAFATLPRLISDLDRLAPGAPLLITRTGFVTVPGGLTEDDQAAYLTQTLQRLAAIPRVRLVSWYSLQDSPQRPSGLLRADGSEKPAWVVFRNGPKSLQSAAP